MQTFDDWWKQACENDEVCSHDYYVTQKAWDAASRAMRNRCVAICLEEASCWTGDASYHCSFCADVIADLEVE